MPTSVSVPTIVEQILDVNNGLLESIFSDDPQRIMQQAAKHSATLLDAEFCLIWIQSESPKRSLRLATGFPEEAFEDEGRSEWSRDHFEDPTLVKVMQSGVPCRLESDELSETSDAAWFAQLSEAQQCVGILAVPIMNRRLRIIGVLEFVNKRTEGGEIVPFSHDDESPATKLARDVWLLLSLSRILGLYREHFSALSNAGSADELHTLVRKTALKLVEADGGNLAIWNADKEDLFFHTPNGNATFLGRAAVPQAHVIRTVWRTGDPNVSHNKSKSVSSSRDKQVRSEIAIRWELDGQPIGVLHAESFVANYFDQVDVTGLKCLLQAVGYEYRAVRRALHLGTLTQSFVDNEVPDRQEVLRTILESVSLLNNPVGMAGVFAWARMGLPRR
jgi:transcriptional regulator with GAF, ATPase, and Fis domain